jgi:hypothetical protein
LADQACFHLRSTSIVASSEWRRCSSIASRQSGIQPQ